MTTEIINKIIGGALLLICIFNLIMFAVKTKIPDKDINDQILPPSKKLKTDYALYRVLQVGEIINFTKDQIYIPESNEWIQVNKSEHNKVVTLNMLPVRRKI